MVNDYRTKVVLRKRVQHPCTMLFRVRSEDTGLSCLLSGLLLRPQLKGSIEYQLWEGISILGNSP